jgi:NAD(P)-dependent dehydrogenase (short-subunit alcohol dehydrogenase family)
MMRDKVIAITGASGALGRVVAATLAAQGARLALLEAAPKLADALAKAFASHLLIPATDLSRLEAASAAIAQVVAHYGGLDALVNIAGGFRWQTLEGGDLAVWDLMWALNLKTALNACKASLPHLVARGRGRIVNIGAGAAQKAAAGMGAYAASKSGVLRLTEALAQETKDRNITVNAILPGTIDTPANRKDMPDADFARWVEPSAIADVIAFLLSDGARAITGAAIPVSGRQ